MPVHHDEPRGSEGLSEPRFLVIGRITKPHGVRGEVRVKAHTDLPERFKWLEHVYVGDGPPTLAQVEKVRFHRGGVILKLVGCDTRNQAESLRGEWVQVPEGEAIPLQEGEFFLFQLIGLQVQTTEGESLGVLTEVLRTGANDVFVVAKADGTGELLLPDIPQVVLKVDLKAGRIVVQPGGFRDG